MCHFGYFAMLNLLDAILQSRAEQFVFRSKFVGWEGVLREDYSIVKGEKKSTEQKAPKVNLFIDEVS